jgi:glycosyltransferase involved in cell wall biosynthesis
MNDAATQGPARIFTTWGTVLYVDVASGELRHGPIETSPANAVFALDPTATGPRRQGWLMHDEAGRLAPIAYGALACRAVPSTATGDPPIPPTLLDLVPLERGLIALSEGGRFLCAQPDGRLDLANTWCSTWECFLASEDWCGAALPEGQPEDAQKLPIDWKGIAKFIVDARRRAKTSAGSAATKVLIYGYPAWSHGRVYYDLCKHLYNKGYTVDIINWQINHADYIDELKSAYDLFISALDGVRTLIEVYGVPAEKVIGLSHHEMDIRMLLEQMGKGVFEQLGGYGVVSYQLFDASVLFGIPRHPLVVALGVNFDEFRAAIPERLEIVGYAGSYSHKTLDGIEWKRGDIAEAAAREAGLEFKVAGWTGSQIPIHDMPEFYKSVDAILVSSVTEGAQMPVREGAAAGRLVISTPVGDAPLRAAQGICILAPIESHKYKKFVADTLRYCKENPAAFTEMCRKTQEAARKLDWEYMIDDWVELIEEAKAHAVQSPKAQNIPEDDPTEKSSTNGVRLSNTYSPFFTIIMPTHSRPALLERALLSVITQGFNDYELIVISDDDNPQSYTVASSVLRRHDTFLKRNGLPGPSRSRNLGIELARGCFCLFLDDDDTHRIGSLFHLFKAIESGRSDIFYFDYERILESRLQNPPDVKERQYISTGHQNINNIFLENFIPINAFALRRAYANQFRFDETLRSLEDWDFLLSVFKAGYQFVHLPISAVAVHHDISQKDRHRNSRYEPLDFLHIYRRWPADSEPDREARRAKLMQSGYDVRAADL